MIRQCEQGHTYLDGPTCPWCRIAELEQSIVEMQKCGNGANCCHQAARIEALERQLAMANDAAAKGDLARANAGGMEMRIQELEKALHEATVMVEEWASYASPYFQEKHDLAGDLKRLRSVIDATSSE